MMFATSLLLILSLFVLCCFNVSAEETTQYCATIKAGQASGATGYVALQIGEGQAQYSFSLNIANFETTLCPDMSAGFSYHIHVGWQNTTAMSTANSLCTTAGAHYDPNFACSNFSQYYKNDCPLLERTFPQGYRYGCNPANYSLGRYAQCELGDTSSKFGLAYAENDIVSMTNLIDFQPPYAANFDSTSQLSSAWLSWVFHCAANTQRLVCARFSTTDLSACSSAFSAMSEESSDDDKVTTTKFNNAVIISTVVCTVGSLIIGLLIGKYCFASHGGLTDPLNRT